MCAAAPVEEEGVPEVVPEGDVEAELSVRLPPVPALTVGETLVSIAAEAFLKASRVRAPVALQAVRKERIRHRNQNLRWVDHADHAILAVLALCAVEPDGRGSIGDLIGKCPVGNVVCVRGRNKTRPEAIVHRLAG